MGYTDEQLLRMVNRHSDVTSIMYYIMDYSEDYLSEIDAREIAEELVNKYGYTRELARNGEINHIVDNYIRRKNIKESSVKKEKEIEFEVLLKAITKNISKYWLEYILVGALSVTAISMVFGGKKEKEPTVDELFGMIASQYDDDKFDYRYKQTIVEQNIFYPQSYDVNGDRTIAYSIDGIANDIIRVCERDPQLFDFCMVSTYFDVDWYRLDTMTDVLKTIEIRIEGKEEFKGISEKIQPCNSYIDYILTCGLVEPTPEMLQAVTTYKAKGYTNLPKEEKKEFDNLIQLYKNAYHDLSQEYTDELKEQLGIGEEYGTRKN